MIQLILWRQINREPTCLLAHVEVNAARNLIFLRKPAAGPEHFGLHELIRVRWKGADDILGASEIVEGTILVAEDF